MFKKGEYILYGTVGVCQVEGILKPDFSNNDKVYYSLVPKFDQDTTIYIPVDSPKVKMREIMTRQEAEQFILALPSVACKRYANDKERPQVYRQVLESGDCVELASMIKEISEMEQHRRGKGKPLSIRERMASRAPGSCCLVSWPLPWISVRRRFRIILPARLGNRDISVKHLTILI